jgi:hypothetical protein
LAGFLMRNAWTLLFVVPVVAVAFSLFLEQLAIGKELRSGKLSIRSRLVIMACGIAVFALMFMLLATGIIS